MAAVSMMLTCVVKQIPIQNNTHQPNRNNKQTNRSLPTVTICKGVLETRTHRALPLEYKSLQLANPGCRPTRYPQTR